MSPSFDLEALAVQAAHLAGAFVLAVPLGLQRERSRSRGAPGLRTFPLVAMATCGFILVVRPMLEDDPNAIGRLLAGVMTGIGFIGGGAILKSDGGVHGTATAAAVWITGAMGAAVAFGRYSIAILLSVATLAVLLLAPLVKPRVEDEDDPRPAS